MMTRRHILLLLAATPAACGSPRLYMLTAVPGALGTGAPHAIELREIEIACYMDRSEIVRSSDNLRLDVLDNERWGEPLDAMLGRVLVTELTQRLPGSFVFAENSAVVAKADSTVGINILSLDADQAGTVILLAQIAITGRKPAMRSVRLVAPLPSPDTPGLISAMSTTTAQLADTVAEMLERPTGAATAEQTEISGLRKKLKREQKEHNILNKAINTLSDQPK